MLCHRSFRLDGLFLQLPQKYYIVLKFFLTAHPLAKHGLLLSKFLTRHRTSQQHIKDRLTLCEKPETCSNPWLLPYRFLIFLFNE